MAIFKRELKDIINNEEAYTSHELEDIIEDTDDDSYSLDGIKWITEQHVACVFLLDTSGSMLNNEAIKKLNEGLKTFKEQTVNDVRFDNHTKACIDVAIVTFGPDVKIIQDFKNVAEMIPPTLTAGGGTPLGPALETALKMITNQKEKYNRIGTPYFRPWIFCITDGRPNGEYREAVEELKRYEREKKVLGYCVGVDGYDKEKALEIFDVERIYELDNLNFPALFEFVSTSLSTIRNSDSLSSDQMQVEAHKDIHMISFQR